MPPPPPESLAQREDPHQSQRISYRERESERERTLDKWAANVCWLTATLRVKDRKQRQSRRHRQLGGLKWPLECVVLQQQTDRTGNAVQDPHTPRPHTCCRNPWLALPARKRISCLCRRRQGVAFEVCRLSQHLVPSRLTIFAIYSALLSVWTHKSQLLKALETLNLACRFLYNMHRVR